MPRLFTGIEVPAETAQWLAATARRPLRGALDRPRGLSRDAALHRRRRCAHRQRDRRASRRSASPARVDRIRRPGLVRRRQAARDRRADQAECRPDGSAGDAGAPPSPARPAAGDAQFSPPCHAGEVALDFADRRRRLSERARRRAARPASRRRVLCSIRREIRSAAAPISSKPPILCAEGPHDAVAYRRPAPPRSARSARSRVLQRSLSRLSRNRAPPRRSSSGRNTASGASAATPTSRRCCATGGSAGRSCMWRAERASAGPSRPSISNRSRRSSAIRCWSSSRPSTRGCARWSIAPSSRARSNGSAPRIARARA